MATAGVRQVGDMRSHGDRRRGLSAVFVACSLLAACANGASSRDEPGVEVPEGAVSEGALSGPGTELGNGITVAAGSSLIGAVVPLGTTVVLDGVPIVDPGWEALLYVSGDPRDVMGDYLAQARAAGFEITEIASGEPFAMEGEAEPPTGFGLCAGVGGKSYECSAMASRNDGECLVLQLVRSDTASHLTVRLKLGQPHPCEGRSGVPGAPDRDPPTGPTTWPDRPPTGEPLGAAWRTLAPLEVQEGSALVAAPAWRSGCGGPIAVLEVTDDPSAVLDRYAREIERISVVPPQVFTEEATLGTSRLQRHRASEPGGGRTFALDLVTDAGAAWIFMHACDG